MEKNYKCKCGGLLILDDEKRTSAHSVPPCKAYIDNTTAAGAKYEGTQLRDGETLRVKESRTPS